ncbi:MAG: hypothetical protein ACREVO_14785 [Steroidobacteraceae bacterium]
MKSPSKFTPILQRFGLPLLYLAATMSAASAAVYPSMAPIARYQSVDQAAEIAFARSAAPASISGGAQILALGKHGYETAVKGGNGFVCLVVRSWDMNFNNPEFWNPKIRSPQCFNAAGANSVLRNYLARTRWVLAGDSLAKMRARARTYQRVMPAPGSVCYMMSRQAYLNDTTAGPWYSHVMFFGLGKPADWGANLPDSPMAADSAAYAPVTIFMVVVQKWSDGTPNRKQ